MELTLRRSFSADLFDHICLTEEGIHYNITQFLQTDLEEHNVVESLSEHEKFVEGCVKILLLAHKSSFDEFEELYK